MTYRMISRLWRICALCALVLAGAPQVAQAAPTAPPAAPTNISCQGYEKDAVVLYWKDKATDETEYRVERSVGGAAFSEVATLAADSTSWKETGIDPSVQNRRYRVRAYRASGVDNFSDYSPICNNRRVYETAHFRFFYGLRGTSDDCPQINTNDVCLANVNDGAVNRYIKLSADALEGSLASFQRLGFTRDAGAHATLDKIPINVVWCDGGGCAGGGGLGLSPLLMETAFDLVTRTGDPIAYLVAEHEAFHFQQFKYGGISGEPDDRWIYEGQARMSQDKVCVGGNRATCLAFDDVDGGYAGYVPEIDWYLANIHNSLTLSHYGGALFWAYLTEQYGTSVPADSVENGMNLVVEFWNESAATPGRDGITVLDDTLATLGHSERFRDIWKDFVIAAYTKNLTGAGVAAKYAFEDMAEPGGTYDLPKLSVNQALALNDSVLRTGETVYPWGARYYQVMPAADVPVIPIKVVQDTPHQLFYVILGVQGNNLTYIDTVVARNLDRTLVNNGYSKVIVAVGGLDNLANYRVSINGTQPSLRILNPTTGTKARVGDPAAPDKFLTAVEVVAGDGTPLSGIELGQFSFQVGAQPVVASSIVASSTVQGQQWFVLRAPSQASSGQYDLTVRYSTLLTGTQPSAVDYTPRNNADSMLLIDRSGSMGASGKLGAAGNAARLYVDSWKNGDKIGVISFNENPSNPPDLTLRNWTDAPAGGSRVQAFAAITALAASGGTNIGDTLMAGWDQLKTSGDSGHDWALVLLSDGKEEASSPTKSFPDAVNAIADAPAGEKKPVIHAVAIGPDADGPRMQWAASRTGGTYQFVSIPAPLMAAGVEGAAAVAASNLKLGIDSKYRYIATEVLGRQQIYSYFGPKSLDQSAREALSIPVEKGAAELVLSVSWDGLMGNITLRDPDSITYPPSETDGQHRVWRVPTPKDGVWSLFVEQFTIGVAAADGNTIDAPAAINALPPYYVQVALKSDVTMDSFLGTPPDDRTPGAPMSILTMLTDNTPVLGADVSAAVENPFGTVVSTKLWDDGNHGDGGVNDGLYANTFYQTGFLGNYNVTINAAGVGSIAGPFSRQDLLSFNIFSTKDNPDEDDDGIPDDWERRYYGDPARYGPKDDPDHDGVPTVTEWQQGTDPMDPDTDDDGEADGTDPNPLEPGDNRIDPTRIVVFPGISRVYIRWTPRPNYRFLDIFRGDNPDGPFEYIGDVDLNNVDEVIEDQQLTNGRQYCYIAMARDAQGVRAAPSAPSCASPKADPLPPHGAVLINDGATTTASPNVILRLIASDDDSPESEPPDGFSPEFPSDTATGVVDMLISNQGDFTGAQWEPYAASKPWDLGVTAGSTATVFVKYRDGAGNESVPAVAGIKVVDLGSTLTNQTFLPVITNQ